MHRPVMVAEVLAVLAVERGGVFVDCTVGEGGHARAILERGGPGVRLIGLDRDEEALTVAADSLREFSPQVTLHRESFAHLSGVLAREGVEQVSGVLFDLGVSSPQLDRPERGFSYQKSGPLDMRMDSRQPLTAADLVNSLPEEELAGLIARYGEERWAGRIARFIVEWRSRKPLLTTDELVEVIKAAMPAGARRYGGHPARRTFQALRIAVNDELGELERALGPAFAACAPGGRLCVISFHSLEDRVVKRCFADLAAGPARLLTRRPLRPCSQEVATNPRARSARLRAVERVA